MKKDSFDDDEIKVKRRTTDRLYFESPFIQSISDGIDSLKTESREFLRDIDATDIKQEIEDFDLDEYGVQAFNRVTGVVDNVAEFRDQIIDDDIPHVIRKSSNDFKLALNRDADYIKKVKRRLMNEDYDNYERIIKLCDKAIAVNKRNWEAYYYKGIALGEIGEYGDSAKQFVKTLALNDTVDIRLHAANAYRLNGDFAKAIGAYNSVLRKEEDSFDALKGIAFTYYNWGKYEKADEFFSKANSIKLLNPKSKKVWDKCLEKMQ